MGWMKKIPREGGKRGGSLVVSQEAAESEKEGLKVLWVQIRQPSNLLVGGADKEKLSPSQGEHKRSQPVSNVRALSVFTWCSYVSEGRQRCFSQNK